MSAGNSFFKLLNGISAEAGFRLFYRRELRELRETHVICFFISFLNVVSRSSRCSRR
jgi:hypothetical protein